MLIGVLAAFSLFVPLVSFSQQTISIREAVHWKAQIVAIQPLSTISWTPSEVWVETDGLTQYSDLKFVVDGKPKSVKINGQKVSPKSDESYQLTFGFTETDKGLQVIVEQPDGKTEEGTFTLLPVDADQPKRAGNRLRFVAGFGLTAIRYKQNHLDNFSETAMTVKGGMNYRLVPNQFDLSLSAFLNAFTFSPNANYSIQYLGVNARLGYHLLDEPSPLRITLNGGLYYNTSFGSIGFVDMIGPQLYPEFVYSFSNGRAILLYFKYSPAIVQGSGIDFSINKEAASGIYYLFPLDQKYRMGVGFDISKLDLTAGNDAAHTLTYSLSTSISF